MEEYGNRFRKLNLVLFDDALEHLTRVHRAVRMHRGHAMLIGTGGSGKASFTRLAAFTAGTFILKYFLMAFTIYYFEYFSVS